ncbi:septum site-determining protein MinC [Aureimonas populi]|uniref:Probable septum site-determining protein MinC n=1 Tax=Aureimonas populi TaxID=1701758 RepID=A0ABW5CJL9_9HYPH|nr:septum site-determining protein MinC [Aureimonas populi]
MTETLSPKKAVRLRGRSFLALALSPEKPFAEWLEGLDDLARRSTGFFLNRPIVLDIAGLTLTKDELAGLVGEFEKRNVRIMGIEGALPSLLGPGMPPEMRGGRAAGDIEVPETPTSPSGKADTAGQAAAARAPLPVSSALNQPHSLIVEESVRSGQSIVFPEGDVTVLGSVASGAEIIAGGSIHVYGALRGRVLAGSAGNPNARIFCRKLEAELIAIDGLYKTAEDLEPALVGKSMQAWLEGDALKAAPLA